jgi:hypothetical protein
VHAWESIRDHKQAALYKHYSMRSVETETCAQEAPVVHVGVRLTMSSISRPSPSQSPFPGLCMMVI